MFQKWKELTWEAYFISSQEELYVFVWRPAFCRTPNAKAKAVPMDSWWVHNTAGPEASLDWQRSSKSMCLGSELICPGSHPRISGNQVGVPKLYMLLDKSLTPVPFLQACHSLLLEMIMIKFHLTISSNNCQGQLEIWMQKIEIGPLPYTT